MCGYGLMHHHCGAVKNLEDNFGIVKVYDTVMYTTIRKFWMWRKGFETGRGGKNTFHSRRGKAIGKVIPS